MPDADAGATPVEGAATTPQTPVAPATPADDASATEYPEGLGEAGKRAIDRMKASKTDAEKRAAKAEEELAKLRRDTQSEAERAIADAKAAGAKEATDRYAAAIRRSEVRAALTSAGVDASFIDLAVRAEQFEDLEVTDNGEVKGLANAVAALQKANPALFAGKPKPNGDAGLGPRGTPPANSDMNDFIRRATGRA